MIPQGKAGDSYFSQYRRVRGLNTNDIHKQKLLTDRSVYLTFLETQLERVSSSCMTVVGFKERMLDVESQIVEMEERLSNGLRRIKLHTPNAEEEEKKFNEMRDLQETVVNLQTRLLALEEKKTKDQLTIQQLNKRINNMEEDAVIKEEVREKREEGVRRSKDEKYATIIDLQTLEKTIPSETKLIKTVSNVLSSNLDNLISKHISTSLDPKLNDIIKFVETSNQKVATAFSETLAKEIRAVEEKLTKQTTKTLQIEKERIIEKCQSWFIEQQQQFESKPPTTATTTATAPTVNNNSNAANNEDQNNPTALVSHKSHQKRKQGKHKGKKEGVITHTKEDIVAISTNLFEFKSQLDNLKEEIQESKLQQDNLSKITANAINTVARRVRNVESVSQVSTEASKRILNLVENSRDEKNSSRERMESAIETMKKSMLATDKRITKIETLQNNHAEQIEHIEQMEERRNHQEKEYKQQEERRLELKKIKDANETAIKSMLNREEEIRRRENEIKNAELNELKDQLTKEKELRIHLEEKLEKESITTSSTKFSGENIRKIRRNNSTSPIPPISPTIDETRSIAQQVYEKESQKLQKTFDRKIMKELNILKNSIKKKDDYNDNMNIDLKKSIENEVKSMIMKCQLGLVRQVETQVETAIVKHMKKNITRMNDEIKLKIDSSFTSYSRIQENFIKGARETMNLEICSLKKHIEKYLQDCSKKIFGEIDSMGEEQETLKEKLERMVVRTVNDVVVEQEKRLRPRDQEKAMAEAAAAVSAEQFRSDLQFLREDLNRVTESVNGTADHYVYLRKELNGMKSGVENIPSKRISINLNGSIDGKEEVDVLDNVLDELRAWTTKDDQEQEREKEREKEREREREESNKQDEDRLVEYRRLRKKEKTHKKGVNTTSKWKTAVQKLKKSRSAKTTKSSGGNKKLKMSRRNKLRAFDAYL
jgi:hypothetical protein